ncbi:MAG: dihydroorotase [Rikenellaceae bacterium]|nr:dihydroorotase [Rikenellaceae bacterium]MCL2692147.1 dihydroorotase [Rikenellaceae bacterium]
MEILIKNGRLVNEGHEYENGTLLIRGERIAEIGRPEADYTDFKGRVIDARGCLVIPGVIDPHVHFREPGLTYKGDMYSESRAAVAGGVTSYMDMPNTIPATTTLDDIARKEEMAAVSSVANYAFYLGATNENIEQVRRIDSSRVCGVKLFMGSSTGGMLVDDDYSISAIFAESPVIVAVHSEDERIIQENMRLFRERYGGDIKPEWHAEIRSAEACYAATARAVELADKYGADLHVLHLSTARELPLFSAKPLSDKHITAEACVNHLWFAAPDYAVKGNLIKVNPAIKSVEDRDALRTAVADGRIDIVATDHAPHTLDEKRLPYWECPSGLPSIEHSLAMMLGLAAAGFFSIGDVVEKMCHAPARRYGVRQRGFLREGMFADIALVTTNADWRVSDREVLYKCGWSPIAGSTLRHRVRTTIINGRVVYDNGVFDESFRGMPLEFDRARA